MPSSIKDWTDLIVLPSSPCIAPNSIITSTSSAQIGLAPGTNNNPVARQLESGRVVIDAADFCEFRKMQTRAVGNRLTKERLDFVCHFAFPPSHAELLPIRQSKKERAAYDAQAMEELEDHADELDDAEAESKDSTALPG